MSRIHTTPANQFVVHLSCPTLQHWQSYYQPSNAPLPLGLGDWEPSFPCCLAGFWTPRLPSQSLTHEPPSPLVAPHQCRLCAFSLSQLTAQSWAMLRVRRSTNSLNLLPDAQLRFQQQIPTLVIASPSISLFLFPYLYFFYSFPSSLLCMKQCRASQPVTFTSVRRSGKSLRLLMSPAPHPYPHPLTGAARLPLF